MNKTVILVNILLAKSQEKQIIRLSQAIANSHAIAQFNENEIFYSQGEMYYKSPRAISK
jgi:hypothetical protein